MYSAPLGYVFCVLSLSLVGGPGLATAVTLNPNPKLVVFSFDGFRYDYLSLANAPTLTRLRSQGVTTPYMIPQFTTKTFPNHQSIVTGLFSEKHGIVENAVFDPVYGHLLSGYLDEKEFWVYSDDVVPIWLLNEMAGEGRISGAQFPGSTQAYGPQQKNITFALKYQNSTAFPYKERMDTTISWLTNDTTPANLVFMYFDEPDTQGHRFGPNSPEVKAAIENLDKMTEYFVSELSRLGIQDEVNIIILSDHGMQEVKEKNQIKLEEFGIDTTLYKRRGSSPLLQIWPHDEANTERLYEEFLGASRTRPFTVYRNDSLPEKWRYQNRRVSPILLLALAGFRFNEVWEPEVKDHQRRRREPNSEDPEITGGFHGYDIDSPDMRSFFLANGPAFNKAKYIEPFPNIDLFSLMAKVIGITPPKHDGDFNRVAGALRTNNSSVSIKISNPGFIILLTAVASQFMRTFV